MLTEPGSLLEISTFDMLSVYPLLTGTNGFKESQGLFRSLVYIGWLWFVIRVTNNALIMGILLCSPAEDR